MTLNDELAIATAHLDAAGWGLLDFAGPSIFDVHAIYVRDFRSGRLKLFCMEKALFSEALKAEKMSVMVAVITNLIPGAIDNSLSESKLNLLSKSLHDYIRSTTTYELWRMQAMHGDRLHAVVNIYPCGGLPVLRPFVMRTADILLSPAEVTMASLDASIVDQHNHPDWF
jgi:hypothetical protein